MAKILVACEFSGIVRDEFIRAGHDAVSCDIEPSERPGPHLQCDVLTVLDRGWDMMIAFPPCKYLALSGLHWNTKRPWRAALTEQALDFVRALMAAPIPHIAIENSVGKISTAIMQPAQVVHPWHFGDLANKRTCLWLFNLPRLVPTSDIRGGRGVRMPNQTASGQNRIGESKAREKLRSRTYPGIARAMADQWGKVQIQSRQGPDTNPEV